MAKIVLPNGQVVRKNIFEIIVFCILVFVSLSAGTQWGYGYRGITMNILCFICVVASVLRKRHKINCESIICLVLAGFIFLNAMFSIDKTASLQWAKYILSMLLVIMYSFDTDFWIRYEKVCFVWAIIMAISVIVSAISPTFITTFFGWVLGYTSDNAVTFLKKAASGQYAGFAREIAEAAVICNYGIAVCYAKLFVEKKVFKKDIIFLFLLFIGLILTTKRTLFIVPFLLIPVLVLLTQKGLSNKIKWMLIFFVIVSFVAILIFNVPQLGKIVERFTETENYEDMGGRATLWEISRDMFVNAKIMGQGYGAYNTYAFNYGFRFMGEKWVSNGHNIYLQLLGETGIVGFVLIMSSFLLVLLKSINCLRKSYVTDDDKKHLVFCVYIQIMFLVYGVTGNVLIYLQQLMVWVIVVAYAISIIRRYKRRER